MLQALFIWGTRFTDVKFDFPKLLVCPDFLDLLLPTLIFIYLIRIFFRDFNFKDYYPFLILPAAWAIVLCSFVLIKKDFRLTSYINTDLHLLSQILVCVWKIFLLIKIFKYFRWSSQPLKDKHKDLLQWARTLMIFMALLTFVSVFNLAFFCYRKFTVPVDTTVVNILRDITSIDYILFTCFIIFISIYFFTKQPLVLEGLSQFKSNKKRQDSVVFDDLFNNLLIMEQNKVLFDTELDERALAEKLGVKSYMVSRLLNERLGKSFNEYINEKRIAEAKRLLETKELDHLTMYAIALDSGFKSESGFYANFKKHTGMTPNQYKKKYFKS